MVVNDAVATTNPALSRLAIRADNGFQYTSREFRSSITAPRITLKYTCINTPEQNGHIESFHKTLKKEYVWPREFADIREAIRAAFHDYSHSRNTLCPGIPDSEFAERWQQNTEDAGSCGKQITE